MRGSPSTCSNTDDFHLGFGARHRTERSGQRLTLPLISISTGRVHLLEERGAHACHGRALASAGRAGAAHVGRGGVLDVLEQHRQQMLIPGVLTVWTVEGARQGLQLGVTQLGCIQPRPPVYPGLILCGKPVLDCREQRHAYALQSQHGLNDLSRIVKGYLTVSGWPCID